MEVLSLIVNGYCLSRHYIGGSSCPGSTECHAVCCTCMRYVYSHQESVRRKRKPPLGIMPTKLHRQKRMEDILNAMQRYTEADKQLPTEWLEELEIINGRIYA